MLQELEKVRQHLSSKTEGAKKSKLGQYFTPIETARFMAGLFPAATGDCRLLDAGAGIGSLTAAFLERWLTGELGDGRVSVDLFELDESIHPQLAATLSNYTCAGITSRLFGRDFVEAAAEALSDGFFASELPRYTHAILNPPYKKIGNRSSHRLALRSVGIETVNLYSGFVALAVALAEPGAQIVAIIPRSFCNGPYYRPFRDFILARAAIRHIHLFDSRNAAFKDDAVLQENVIIRLECGAVASKVSISSSADADFSELSLSEHPFHRIVFPDDTQNYIHVPTTTDSSELELLTEIRYSLADLGIGASTGPVVDFRLKEHLRDMPVPGTVPLLYPAHFSGATTNWPIEGNSKPNAIEQNSQTEKWLYPNGHYCVVRRFSSKEEKRRIVASKVEPGAFAGAAALGFENHLNVFHENRRGLPEALASGLTMYLNTTAVDQAFRRFNGHTQVNVTDLKSMKYPSREFLMGLGNWALGQQDLSQDAIDSRFASMCAA